MLISQGSIKDRCNDFVGSSHANRLIRLPNGSNTLRRQLVEIFISRLEGSQYRPEIHPDDNLGRQLYQGQHAMTVMRRYPINGSRSVSSISFGNMGKSYEIHMLQKVTTMNKGEYV